MVKYILLDDDADSDNRGNDSPGRRLREAREQLDLDIKTVAKKLHMNEESIVALENDNYDKFPAPIYVSGFLRNYARLLNLSPEPIVEAYERLGKEAPPILSDLTSKIPRRRRNGIESWAGYLAVGGVLLILLVWMMPSNNRNVKNDEVQIPRETRRESVSTPPVTDNPVTDNVESPVTESPAESATPEVAAENPASDSPLPIPSDTLVLHFTQDSWVEITDSTGRRLFYDMGRAGESSTLLGIAPFSILLGYSPGVSLEYNGTTFDQTPFVRQDVARFKLGKRN